MVVIGQGQSKVELQISHHRLEEILEVEINPGWLMQFLKEQPQIIKQFGLKEKILVMPVMTIK